MSGAAHARPSPRLRRIRAAVLRWYAVEHRDFPWRGTTDPWAVLLSEVMLQQTQASRVAERFGELLRRFPTPEAMADASDGEALVAWSGLGYNRRALALRRAAAAIAADGWPADPEGLRRLPGIGPYTARAVAALAFGHPVGAVDTNVRRWLVRRLGLDADARPTELQRWADALAAPARDAPEAASWVHASMEFGARVCRARAPLCHACPIAAGCPARGRGRHVPVPRQAPFAGSLRASRGAVLRALAGAPGHRMPLHRLATVVDGASLGHVLEALERDGLAHRAGETVRLGSADPERPAATIGP